MKTIGVIATILLVWWLANQGMVYILSLTAPSDEGFYRHIYYGAEIIKWVNIVAVICGLTWLVRKAFK